MFKLLGLISAVFISTGAVAQTNAPPEFAQWAAIKTPSPGATEIFGTYQDGCIAGAHTLPLDGMGYTVVRRFRNRFFGHQNLLNFIQALAGNLHQASGQLVVVEDMGYPRGGPFYNGHVSHQIGLDVDISLRTITKKLSQSESDAWISPSYVTNRKVLKSNWGADQARLVPLAAAQSDVNRIFVAPAIKKYFCETTPKAPWLYKLRAWWGHDDHIHVRLSCPQGSANCVSQPALDPNDNGCGSDLGWWYSAEADAEWTQMQQAPPEPRPYPAMPAQCNALLRQ